MLWSCSDGMAFFFKSAYLGVFVGECDSYNVDVSQNKIKNEKNNISPSVFINDELCH